MLIADVLVCRSRFHVTISGFRKQEKTDYQIIRRHIMKNEQTKKRFGRAFIFITHVCVLTVIFLCQGCERPKPKPKQENDYLIRVQTSYLTVDEFKKSFEIARIAYPYEMFKPFEAGEIKDQQSKSDLKALNEYKKKQLRIMKTRLLSQLTERLILHERARELNISVTSTEIEKEISKVKSSYPEDEFEKSLLESAVSFELWKKQLEDRMLMEKVISKDLRDEIQITSEELAEYYQKIAGDDSAKDSEKSEEIEQKIMEHIRAKKVEEAYADWIQNLKKRYDVVINKDQWKKIEDS